MIPIGAQFGRIARQYHDRPVQAQLLLETGIAPIVKSNCVPVNVDGVEAATGEADAKRGRTPPAPVMSRTSGRAIQAGLRVSGYKGTGFILHSGRSF